MTTLGGFESWADTLAEVLEHAGVERFLENLEALYVQTDEEAGEWEAFLTAWAAHYGDKAIPVAELADDVLINRGDLRDALPSTLADSLDKSRDSTPSQGFKVKLGKALSKKEGTRYRADELYLEIADRDTRSGSPRWRVCAGVQGSQGLLQPFAGEDDDDIPF